MKPMTFFQELYQDSIGKNEPISVRDKSYQTQKFRQQVFGRIAKAFADRAATFGLTKAKVAILLDKDQAQINRMLAVPANLTLDTVSELALALNLEPKIIFDDLDENPRHNYSNFCYNTEGSGPVHFFKIQSLSTAFSSNPIKSSEAGKFELVQ
jgi:hypothetical protein